MKELFPRNPYIQTKETAHPHPCSEGPCEAVPAPATRWANLPHIEEWQDAVEALDTLQGYDSWHAANFGEPEI